MYDIGDLDGDILVGDMDGDDILGDIDGDDILGQLDLSGDMDGDSIVGDLEGLRNPFRRRRKKNAAIKKALIQRKIARGTMVRSLKPVAERNLFIGFQSLAIAANALATITQQPQLPFKGYRLSVPQQFAPFFTIVDIRVGKDSQLVSPGAVPATSFNEVSVGDNISMDTADVGQLITLQVQNIDGAAPHDFRATLFGKTVLMGRC
jgi:hypothetical protein